MVSGTELVGHRASLSLSIKKIFLCSSGISLLFLDPIDPSNTSQSIGNGFPVQKYIGAMVRKSVRAVLVAENDLPEVARDLGAEEPRRSSQGRLGRPRAVQRDSWIMGREI